MEGTDRQTIEGTVANDSKDNYDCKKVRTKENSRLRYQTPSNPISKTGRKS